MNYSELKEKIDQYVETLGATDGWLAGGAVLNGFLWWLYPNLKDEDLPDYGESPLKQAYEAWHFMKVATEHFEPDCSLCNDTGYVPSALSWDGTFVTCPRCR